MSLQHVFSTCVCVLCSNLQACALTVSPGWQAQDITQLGKIYDIPGITSTPVNDTDMQEYYNTTTERDYRVLQFFKGPGLHSTLCSPDPMWCSAGTSVQPTMVLERMSRLQCKRVLEVGCAQGFCTLFLAHLCPDVAFRGIDIVPRHIEIAKHYGQGESFANAQFTTCDATALDAFEDETFDLIFAVEALCHLDTPQKRNDFLTRASQRLTKGGAVLMIDGFRSPEFAEANPQQQLAMQLAEKAFYINEMPSKNTWRQHALDLDFDVVEDKDLTAQVLPFWEQGWRVVHFALNFAYILKYVCMCFRLTKPAMANFLAVATTAHAFQDRCTAEYGLLMLQKKK